VVRARGLSIGELPSHLLTCYAVLCCFYFIPFIHNILLMYLIDFLIGMLLLLLLSKKCVVCGPQLPSFLLNPHVLCFISDINAQHQIFNTRYRSNSNIRKGAIPSPYTRLNAVLTQSMYAGRETCLYIL